MKPPFLKTKTMETPSVPAFPRCQAPAAPGHQMRCARRWGVEAPDLSVSSGFMVMSGDFMVNYSDFMVTLWWFMVILWWFYAGIYGDIMVVYSDSWWFMVISWIIVIDGGLRWFMMVHDDLCDFTGGLEQWWFMVIYSDFNGDFTMKSWRIQWWIHWWFHGELMVLWWVIFWWWWNGDQMGSNWIYSNHHNDWYLITISPST